tara:strand:- start:93 stop:1409 length:1317 start_codon:yes stop_codon:yes gene_type:complete
MAFDSVQVRFRDTRTFDSPFASTRAVPFVGSYFEILKSIVEDINTEYFWFFANFMDLKTIDIDYIPEQHEKKQIHVWYNTNPMGGINKEGNVMLIPTQEFKNQMHDLKYLRDYKDINYHPHDNLYQQLITKSSFKLKDPYASYEANDSYYSWLYNKDLDMSVIPNFYPSFWEDVKLYTWGKTKDVMLVPKQQDLKQFYDIQRSVHYDLDYDVKPMDIVFISYDEPSAEQRYNKLKERFPRAKWCKGIMGQTLAYITAASMSDTDYFFAVFPKNELSEDFDFSFQPDRLRNPCHYIFDCYIPSIDLRYGWGGVILYNKDLVYKTTKPDLDFTMSQAHHSVPLLSAISNCNETPLLAYRSSFREVIKLLQMKPTVESQYRLKKWLALGTGVNAEWLHRGAVDGKAHYETYKDDYTKLMYSYDYEWIKDKLKSSYPAETWD